MKLSVHCEEVSGLDILYILVFFSPVSGSWEIFRIKHSAVYHEKNANIMIQTVIRRDGLLGYYLWVIVCLFCPM